MKISLITVCFNSAKTIRDTIESVLLQTYKNLEYIIVDGNSTDGTVDIITDYKLRITNDFPNIAFKWISEKDNGLYDAMNKGIKMATGDIIGIINADDFYFSNDIIERIAKYFCENKNVEATIGNVRFVKPDNLKYTVRYYRSENFRVWMFRFGFMPPHPSFLCYKHNFEKYGYYKTNYKIAADYELLVRFLYIHKLTFKHIGLDVLKMRAGGKSAASIKNTFLLNKEILRACRENSICTNMFLLSLKYFIKIWEVILK